MTISQKFHNHVESQKNSSVKEMDSLNRQLDELTATIRIIKLFENGLCKAGYYAKDGSELAILTDVTVDVKAMTKYISDNQPEIYKPLTKKELENLTFSFNE